MGSSPPIWYVGQPSEVLTIKLSQERCRFGPPNAHPSLLAEPTMDDTIQPAYVHLPTHRALPICQRPAALMVGARQPSIPVSHLPPSTVFSFRIGGVESSS